MLIFITEINIMAATRVTLRIKAIVHIEFIQKPSMLSLQGSRNEQGYQLKMMAVIKVIKVINVIKVIKVVNVIKVIQVIEVITMIKVVNQGDPSD